MPQVFASDKIAVADFFRRIARAADGAVGSDELVGRNAEVIGAHFMSASRAVATGQNNVIWAVQSEFSRNYPNEELEKRGRLR